jgi:type IV secretion system protein VirB6
MPNYATLVYDILDKVDDILKEFVYDGYQGLVDYLEEPLGVAIALFFVCYGMAVSQGWIKGSVSGLTRSIFKIGVIYFLGMNWSHFSLYVYDLFYKGASEIGSAILTASPIQWTSTGGAGVNGGLQYVLIEIWKIAQWIFDNGGITNPGPWLGGVLIGLVGLFLVGIALLEIVIAKCMLSILFVTAPLFIAFTLFEPTQTFFDRWLGACVGYACLMIFICSGLGIVIALDQWILEEIYRSGAKNMTWIDTGTAILVTWVCIGIIKRIAALAMTIGGTVTTISADEMIAGSVGGTLSWAKDKKNSLHREHKSHASQAREGNDNHQNNSIIKHVMRKMRRGDEDYNEK